MDLDNFSFLDNNSVYIIAEACDNHFGKIDNAIKMVDRSYEAGANCIKFQHHLISDEMLLDNFPKSSNFDESLGDFLKNSALSLDDHIKIKDYCEKIGITYLCTPFSFKAALELNQIGLKFFKIGSGELTDIPSLKKIAEFQKPLILSTGMSTPEEIDNSVREISQINSQISLLNCTSEYPAKYEDINLKFISKLIQKYPNYIIGHSDHTGDIYTSFAAVAIGARIIEKHVKLDDSLKGPDSEVSITFEELNELVDGIRKIEKALGSSKIVHEDEKQIREWAHRSVVTIKPIQKGDIFSYENLWTKRPGTGIPSKNLESIIGKKSNKDIPADVLLTFEEIE